MKEIRMLRNRREGRAGKKVEVSDKVASHFIGLGDAELVRDLGSDTETAESEGGETTESEGGETATKLGGEKRTRRRKSA